MKTRNYFITFNTSYIYLIYLSLYQNQKAPFSEVYKTNDQRYVNICLSDQRYVYIKYWLT